MFHVENNTSTINVTNKRNTDPHSADENTEPILFVQSFSMYLSFEEIL
jgi:hypothetical protein